MDEDLEAIRLRAYEIWESEGRTGNPTEHWLRAQQELRQGARTRSEATVQEATPADAVRAAETADAGTADSSD
ncbi:DUF2934 domain-containing protein [Microvirga massiliensis]|uniref:DUF2934 domain-containing protein n=1 Tax=Microvirga massiliensis TaxID=1033741 RepID=UPI00093A07D3